MQASLYNELGYSLGSRYADSCLYYLTKASKLFKEVKDTQHYITARTNMLMTYETLKDSAKTFETYEELASLIKGRGWYTAEQSLYASMVSFYVNCNDSDKINLWEVKLQACEIINLENRSSTQLDSYRALYETKIYKEESAKRAEQLLTAGEQKNNLIGYFSIFVILSLGVVFLLVRESRLKRAVKKANKNYHMLLIESNHRIKNNLQTIISMLEYSNKDLKGKDSQALNRVLGKIQTVSALHKHLYLDVRNEKVDMKTYFNDIISLYHNISNSQFKIVPEISTISIPSERMVYFGLIFNEMLSNIIEHSTSLEKMVTISVIDFEDRLKLTYSDNSSFDATSSSGLGTNLIEQLVKRVEGRNYKLERETGKYQFEFYA